MFLGVSLWQKTPKIGYVRNAVVMEKYQGMKDAQKKYESQSLQYKSNIDTLRFDFQRQVAQFNSEYATLSNKEKELKGEMLQRQEQELQRYVQSIEKQMEEEDARLMQGVLNQINAYTESHAEKNGYDFVFGTTIEGNIMYAKDAFDLTDEVVEGLNKEYREGQ